MMTKHDIELIAPCRDHYDDFCEMVREFHAVGDKNWPHGGTVDDDLAVRDFDAYLRRNRDWSHGQNLPDEYVPRSDFWMVGPEGLLGTGSLRHTLNPRLYYEGGHIGYCIRPTQRHKGYAHRLCDRMLIEARKIGLTRVLLTCDKTNQPSRHTIEKHNAVFEDERPSLKSDNLVRRYWIELE